VAASASPVLTYLEALRERLMPLRDGNVATYIPELGRADPDAFAMCIAASDGYVYEIGDSRLPFTLQSMSKPFVYGLALEDRGKARRPEAHRCRADRRRVQRDQPRAQHGAAVQPDDQRGRDCVPRRSCSGHSAEDRWQRILSLFAAYAGRSLTLDDECTGRRPPAAIATARSPHAAQLRDSRHGRRPGARPVFPPMLDPGDVPRREPDGGDAATGGINPLTG
jgi:hypothetical protein